jgi:hypothetical protein
MVAPVEQLSIGYGAGMTVNCSGTVVIFRQLNQPIKAGVRVGQCGGIMLLDDLLGSAASGA